ncbi:MAG: hypothetical protein RI563_01160 [Thiohalophilus sp.]|uniref:hypothetical protein n=1 Tax=Thiohalophilus sp. TaxID=3028392 RepID=UPI0028702381|nr:hypothetical protein [Thiohalophilus sp.]MDR9435456.1 hypothetical protein [Thiohalophilus sp.]
MKQTLQQWAERFDALTLRERLILGVGALLVIGIVWLEFVYLAQADQNKRLSNRLQTTDSQIAALEQQITALNSESARDPDQANRRRQEKLQEQLAEVDARLQEKTASLISPAQMAQVLEAVLTQKTDLKLIAVRNLPIQPLLELSTDAEGDYPDSGVYRHGMQIEFSGSYLSTLEYLQALQELKWDFYWDSLQLQVKSYPVSSVTITVHTLSLKEGWIGV